MWVCYDSVMHVTKLNTAKKFLPQKPSFRKREKPRPAVAIAGSGANAQRAATVALRRIGNGGSLLRALGPEGEKVKVAALQLLERTDYTHNQTGRASAPLDIEKEAILEVAAGASPRQVEVKYDLTRDYVRHALQRRFGSPEAALAALQGLTLENALACQVKAAIEIPNMTGTQAVMSGAILTDKALALEKAIKERPKTIDFQALSDMGKTLKVLKEIATKR